MKKGMVLIFFLLMVFPLYSHLEQQAVAVTSIPVAVRVFDGGKFIPDLKLDDFEVFENGVIQKIDALYFIEKTQ